MGVLPQDDTTPTKQRSSVGLLLTKRDLFVKQSSSSSSNTTTTKTTNRRFIVKNRFFGCGINKCSSIVSIRICLFLLCILPLLSMWRMTIVGTISTFHRLGNETIMDQPILPEATTITLQRRRQNESTPQHHHQQQQQQAAVLVVIHPQQRLNTTTKTTTTTNTTLTSFARVVKMKQEKQASITNTTTKTNKTTYRDFYLGARFPNGSLGYIADPTALARGREQFLQQQQDQQQDQYYYDDNQTQQQQSSSSSIHHTYWKVLQEYQVQARNGTETGQWLLGPDHVCAYGPGRGFEDDGGYKLLVEKVRIHGLHDDDVGMEENNEDEEKEEHHHQNRSVPPPVRILCAIYTYPRMRDLFRTQAITWGYKCDGFLAFSTETIAELGLVDLLHKGPESYLNMWQKVRSIWIYLYHHYGQDYDYFHLGGDDLYIMVENFRHFLQTISTANNKKKPLFLGQWVPKGRSKQQHNDYVVAGAPGYTLNRKALQLLVEQAMPHCAVHVEASYEDRLISKCFRDYLNVLGGDTRNVETGEQQYHDESPHHLYTAVALLDGQRGSFHSKLLAYFAGLPHPKYYNKNNNNNNNNNVTTGRKHGMDAVSKYSVNFHNLYHPLYVARIHALIFKQTCPKDSPLGRGLRAHYHVIDND